MREKRGKGEGIGALKMKNPYCGFISFGMLHFGGMNIDQDSQKYMMYEESRPATPTLTHFSSSTKVLV